MRNLLLSHLLIFGLSFLDSVQLTQAQQAIISQENNINKEIDNRAKSVIVRIFDFNTSKPGSGVIVKKIRTIDGYRYFVLTNAHVVSSEYKNKNKCNPASLQSKTNVETPDGRIYRVVISPYSQSLCEKADLALLSFDGNEFSEYEFATVQNSDLVPQGEDVYVSGFPCSENACERIDKLVINKSKFIREKSFKNGYQIGYTAQTRSGMSGGGVFDSKGFLIGIHGQGRMDKMGVDVTEDKKVDESKKIILRKYSWAIPSEFFLTSLAEIKNIPKISKERDVNYLDRRLDSIDIQSEKIKAETKQNQNSISKLFQDNYFSRFPISWFVFISLLLPIFLLAIILFKIKRYNDEQAQLLSTITQLLSTGEILSSIQSKNKSK